MGAPASANDYATLGLRPNATLADVESRFQELALKHHPHRNPDPRSAQRFQAIVVAYERIRESGAGRIYRVGEEQPEDRLDEQAAGQEFVPFEQVPWQPPALAPSRWSQLRLPVFCLQAAIAVVFVLVGARFLITAGTDGGAIAALAASPLCSARQTLDCIAELGATVDATTSSQQTPYFGQFAEGVTVHVAGQELAVAVGRAPGADGIAYGSLAFDSLTTVQRWRGQIIGVNSPEGMLPTDATPSSIQTLHLHDALAWLSLALLLAVRPAMVLRGLFRDRRVRLDAVSNAEA